MQDRFGLPATFVQRVISRLHFLYNEDLDEAFVLRFFTLIAQMRDLTKKKYAPWNQQDVVLITYGDSIEKLGEPSMQTFLRFWETYLKPNLSIVHILPFFPYSSDDGFAVQDYMKVNPDLGNWEDIKRLGQEADLMFDLVINHVSASHEWFVNFKNGRAPWTDYFITCPQDADTSSVIRPRSKPLLTPVDTVLGKKWVWTTFSEDQVDLDVSNPEVLWELMRVFLFYLRQGARIIRLDAIAYLWKRLGTSCIHLPETHEVVKLMRDIADLIAPGTLLLTETNVPNDENLSYFGQGDEAHMVYQFSLPPLVLHALYAGNASYLTRWLKSVPNTGNAATFFNFLASHDGIGVRPLEGLLPEGEKQVLLQAMQSYGGYISNKANADGSESPYEINISYFDAMQGTIKGVDAYQEARFLASQTLMLQMKGIPAFYIHSLLGTKNAAGRVKDTGEKRSINRYKWPYDVLIKALENEKLHHGRILHELLRRIAIRREHKAFHPNAEQSVLEISPQVLVMIRESEDMQERIVCVANMLDENVTLSLSKIFVSKGNVIDILQEQTPHVSDGLLYLSPYQVAWLINE